MGRNCGGFKVVLWFFSLDFSEAVDIIRERVIDLRPLITVTYPLADTLEASTVAADRTRAVKVQLAFAQC